MTLRQRSWTLGTYCAAFRRVATAHHTREDQDLFSLLRRLDPRLAPVLDRLTVEHHAIHGALEHLDHALVDRLTGGGPGGGLRASLDRLTETLLDHLDTEEQELKEPLSRPTSDWSPLNA